MATQRVPTTLRRSQGRRVARFTGATLSLLIGGASAACGGAHESADASRAPAQSPGAQESPVPPAARLNSGMDGTSAAPPERGQTSGEGDDDTELVVSREIVARCPVLRVVRQHADAFDQDMVWLAVLESVADCMSEGSPMAQQNIAVSGDEGHRHVVREVLGSRGVAPTRVVAVPPSALGAAECQGGKGCATRVEITIAPGP